LTQKELITGGTGRTVILGAVCYQIATKNMASGFGAETWGIGPGSFTVALNKLIFANPFRRLRETPRPLLDAEPGSANLIELFSTYVSEDSEI
jgi:hypothetical protein